MSGSANIFARRNAWTGGEMSPSAVDQDVRNLRSMLFNLDQGVMSWTRVSSDSAVFVSEFLSDGTAAAPSLAFLSDTNLGIFRSGADDMRVAGGGVDLIAMSGDQTAASTSLLRVQNTNNTNAGSHSKLSTIVGGASAGDPFMLFSVTGATNWAIGIDNSVSDQFCISASTGVGASDAVQITTAGAVTVPAGGLSVTGGNLDVTKSSSGATVSLTVSNTSNTATSKALAQMTVAGSTADDAYTLFNISGGQNWSVGLDNSDSDRFVISSNSTLGTNNAVKIDPTTLGVAISGTNTSDSAGAGYVGEQVSATATATNAPSTGVVGDLASISLTAGDWDISGQIYWTINGASWSAVIAGISTTTGNSTTGLTLGDTRMDFRLTAATTPTAVPITIAPFRVSLSGTVTYYLKYSATFTVATPQAAGRIEARRHR